MQGRPCAVGPLQFDGKLRTNLSQKIVQIRVDYFARGQASQLREMLERIVRDAGNVR
jgi:hypothetical protein